MVYLVGVHTSTQVKKNIKINVIAQSRSTQPTAIAMLFCWGRLEDLVNGKAFQLGTLFTWQ